MVKSKIKISLLVKYVRLCIYFQLLIIHMQGTVLCRWDLKKIRELLFEVKDKWLDIGIELGVDIDVLLRIKMDFNIQADCLREMIRAWLKMYDPLPSLRSLCEVLQSKYVNAMELAEQGS